MNVRQLTWEYQKLITDEPNYHVGSIGNMNFCSYWQGTNCWILELDYPPYLVECTSEQECKDRAQKELYKYVTSFLEEQ